MEWAKFEAALCEETAKEAPDTAGEWLLVNVADPERELVLSPSIL